MIPGVDMNYRQQLELKYRKLNWGLKFVAGFLLIVITAVVFLPEWVLQLLHRRHLHDNGYSHPASLFHEYGVTALLFSLAAAVVLIIIIALVSGWFRLRRKLR
jgi:hypothetical protein